MNGHSDSIDATLNSFGNLTIFQNNRLITFDSYFFSYIYPYSYQEVKRMAKIIQQIQQKIPWLT